METMCKLLIVMASNRAISNGLHCLGPAIEAAIRVNSTRVNLANIALVAAARLRAPSRGDDHAASVDRIGLAIEAPVRR